MSWFKKKNNQGIKSLFRTFLKYSSEAAKTICELESVSGDKITLGLPTPIPISIRISVEFILFYIHILDRVAFPLLPEKRRLKMVGEFVDQTVRALPDLGGDTNKDQIGNKDGVLYFMQFLIRQDEYKQYEELITEDPFVDTAFQRFGQNIAELFDTNSKSAISISCQAAVSTSLKHINLKRFVESLK